MTKTKVALIVAPSEHTLYTYMNLPPLAIGTLSAYLRTGGIDVDPYDLNADIGERFANKKFEKRDLGPFYNKQAVIEFINGGKNDFFTSFAEDLLADKNIEQYDVIGMSCGADFSWLEIHGSFILGKHIQENYGKPVVFGGNNLDYLIQFKVAFKELWAAVLSNFKFIVPGPGEIVLYEIIQHLAKDSSWQPGPTFRGVAYLHNGEPMQTLNQDRIIVRPDFTGLRLEPYYNYVKDPKKAKNEKDAERWNLIQIFKWPAYVSWYANQIFAKHQGNGVMGKLIMPYIFNYNCPYTCAFCTESLERLKVVHATPEQILSDMLDLMEKNSTNYYFFFNNYFNLLKRFVKEFCQEVIDRNIKFHWSDCGRFNHLDFNTLKLMRDAGCTKLTFGLETASPKMLTLIDKKVKLDTAQEVLQWCKELGIWADLEIIIGLPHEYDGDFKETCEFLERNSDTINFFNINRYFVVPHSLMGANPEEYGMELILDPNIYQTLLDTNYTWLCSDLGLSYKPQNFRVYKINEIGGRSEDEIAEATNQKVSAMNGIQNREFTEAWQMLNIVDSQMSRHSVPQRLGR